MFFIIWAALIPTASVSAEPSVSSRKKRTLAPSQALSCLGARFLVQQSPSFHSAVPPRPQACSRPAFLSTCVSRPGAQDCATGEAPPGLPPLWPGGALHPSLSVSGMGAAGESCDSPRIPADASLPTGGRTGA